MNAPLPATALGPPANPPGPAAAMPPATPDAAADLAQLLGEPAARPWFRRPLVWALGVALLAAGGLGAWWWAGRAAKAAPG
jgi:HlyD family secretion protein